MAFKAAESSRRALIVHTGGGLGDILLSRPVVDALSQDGYTVDFLSRHSTAAALEGHPNIDRVMTITTKDPQGLRQMLAWAQRIKAGAYDVALLLWSTSGWAWTLRMAGVPSRVGQDSRLLYSFTFTHRVRVRSEHGDESTHWTEVLLDYPRALGLRPSAPEISYPVGGNTLAGAEQLLGDADFAGRQGPLLGFHSGKGLPLGPERWPVEHFARMARELQEQLDARLVLTGGPGEVEIVSRVTDGLSPGFLNLAGRTDLKTLAGVAKLCEAFVCPDSGPMHLAAAVGTPVVGIYALDEDFPRRWAPFGVPYQVIRPARPACRPGCRKPTCPDFACYLKVQPSAVVEAVRSLLSPGERNLSRDAGTGLTL